MAQFDVDSDLVLKLAALLREAGLGEIEYEFEGQRIRVALPGAAPSAAAAPAPATPVAAAAVPAGNETDDSKHAGAVLSPMVGTVYLSPGPGEPAFVRTGQPVAAGQTLMLIEAMKTFNEVKAHRAGTVARILISNGQAVEFGELLAIVE